MTGQKSPWDGRFHWYLLQGGWYPCLFIGGLVLITGISISWCAVDRAGISWLLAVLLLLQGLMDIRYGLLYDRVNLALVGSAVLPVAVGCVTVEESVSGAMTAAGFLWLLRWLTRGGIGLGDVKLAGAMGLWLGWPRIIPGLGIAFLLGGMGAVYLLLCGNSLKSRLPFGPFLGAGGYLGFLFGEAVIQWYSQWL